VAASDRLSGQRWVVACPWPLPRCCSLPWPARLHGTAARRRSRQAARPARPSQMPLQRTIPRRARGRGCVRFASAYPSRETAARGWGARVSCDLGNFVGNWIWGCLSCARRLKNVPARGRKRLSPAAASGGRPRSGGLLRASPRQGTVRRERREKGAERDRRRVASRV
jgi:hypothetical protein